MKNQEIHYKEYLKNIEQVINNKEREISQLEKELRQLNSFKAIQEIKGSNGRTPQDMKNRRQQRQSLRLSVPINQLPLNQLFTPRGKQSFFPSTPRNDFKIQMFSNQIKFKSEKLIQVEAELNELEVKLIKYELDIEKLTDENSALVEKLQLIQIDNNRKTIENRDSINIPSLYDELSLIKEGSTIEIRKGSNSVDLRAKYIDEGIQNVPELMEISTQTKRIEISQEFTRKCFYWF